MKRQHFHGIERSELFVQAQTQIDFYEGSSQLCRSNSFRWSSSSSPFKCAWSVIPDLFMTLSCSINDVVQTVSYQRVREKGMTRSESSFEIFHSKTSVLSFHCPCFHFEVYLLPLKWRNKKEANEQSSKFLHFNATTNMHHNELWTKQRCRDDLISFRKERITLSNNFLSSTRRTQNQSALIFINRRCNVTKESVRFSCCRWSAIALHTQSRQTETALTTFHE